jgi:hypothetical protein
VMGQGHDARGGRDDPPNSGLTPPRAVPSLNSAVRVGRRRTSGSRWCRMLRPPGAPCGNSSVGRAQPCQGWGRGFESRFPLLGGDLVGSRPSPPFVWRRSQVVRQRSAKPPFGGSTPPGAFRWRAGPIRDRLFAMWCSGGALRTAKRPQVTPTRNREFFPLANVGFRDVPDPLARYSDRYAAVPGPIGVRQLPVQPLVHLSGSYPSEAACFAALTGGPGPPRRQVFFSFRIHTQLNPPLISLKFGAGIGCLSP